MTCCHTEVEVAGRKEIYKVYISDEQIGRDNVTCCRVEIEAADRDTQILCQVQICRDNWTCCHTEIEFADQTCHLNQLQPTGSRSASLSTDPTTPGVRQGSHMNISLETAMTRPGKVRSDPRIFRTEGDRPATRSANRSGVEEGRVVFVMSSGQQGGQGLKRGEWCL